MGLLTYILEKPIDQVAADEAWAAVGSVMLEKVRREVPEYKDIGKDKDTAYLANEYLKERTKEIFAGHDKQVVRIMERIAKDLNKILNV